MSRGRPAAECPTGKRVYLTRREAIEALHALRAAGRGERAKHPCTMGGTERHWHLTSARQIRPWA